MRADLIGPRPLKRPQPLVKGSPEWYAPFQTDEISKSDPFGMRLCDVVVKAIYGDQLCKAEGTQVDSPRAAQAAALGSAPTQRTSASDIGRASTQQASVPTPSTQGTVAGIAGAIPDFSSRSSVSTPGHKMAMAQGHLEHHANEYHRNTQMAGDSTADPKARAQASTNAAEHHRLGTNAQKVINLHTSNGVQATEKHHADLVNHYESNKQNPDHAGGVRHPLQPSGMTLRNVHNPKSGEWDKHYGAGKEIPWHTTEIQEGAKKLYGKVQDVQEKTHDVGAPENMPTGVKETASSEKPTQVSKLAGSTGKTSIQSTPPTQQSGVPGQTLTKLSPSSPTVVSSGEGAKMEGAKKGFDLGKSIAKMFKAIEGQVGVSEQIHPSEASGMKLWGAEPKKNVHVEAAKHWIQGNHKEFQQMQQDHGADPQQHHMKQAAKELGYKTASLGALVHKAMVTYEMSKQEQVRLGKGMTSYARKRLRQDAANSLFHHHVSRARGDHEGAGKHLKTAQDKSREAGAGPTRAMMQSHVQIHQEDVDHANRVSGGPGAGTSSGKLLGSMADQNLKAAKLAVGHNLVGSKFTTATPEKGEQTGQEFRRSLPVRADLIGPRRMKPKSEGSIHKM